MLIGFGTTEAPKTGFDPLGWWRAQDRNVQIILGVSAAAVLATGVWALLGRGTSRKATPNGRRKAGARKALRNRAVKRSRLSCQAAPSVPSCRCAPPKKYRKSGARTAGDYAFPECFMYPVHTAKYTRAAASRFGKFGGNVPTVFRGKVRRRIERAKKRFGIGPFRA